MGPWVELQQVTANLPQNEPYHPIRFPHDLLTPPTIPGGLLGNYRILGILGQGGMGMVLKAEEISLKRLVALKVMKPDQANPEACARFKREAETTAALEHPRIVIIHAVGEFKGTPFIAMPLMKGQSLADRLADRKPLPLVEAVRYAREMTAGLAEAHAHQLIHRDIKPGNVWLEESAEGVHVRLLDFGLVHWEEGHPITRINTVMGTPAYMAPEQARGKKVDPRADLFSLGCVLYEMTTGQKAFTGETPTAILSAVLTEHPPSAGLLNPAIPGDLSALIDRLLSKNSDVRPASATQAADALLLIERGLPENTPTADHQATPPRPKHALTRSRYRLPIAASIALFGIVLMVLVIPTLWKNTGRTSPISSENGDNPSIKKDAKDGSETPEFRVRAINLTHFDSASKRVGVLGDESFSPLLNDSVKINVLLSRPGYGYLLAFRPDGKFNLCLPLDEDSPPELTETLVYHPTDADGVYGLEEGTGLWVFAVVASEKPLPPLEEWKVKLGSKLLRSPAPEQSYPGPSAWKPINANPGVIWWDDGIWIQTKTVIGVSSVHRGTNKKLDGPEQRVKAVTDLLGAAGETNGAKAAAIGFGVGPKK